MDAPLLSSLILPVYGIWLLFTGSPIFWMRARTIYSRPVILYDDWFRVAGGITIFRYVLDGLLGIHIGFVDTILWIAAGVAYLAALWRALSLKV